jgi:hypothetical protein
MAGHEKCRKEKKDRGLARFPLIFHKYQKTLRDGGFLVG